MDRRETKKVKRELFSQKWFEQRAIDSLQKTEYGWWDYSDSLLLYAGEIGVEEYENIQQGESRYAQLVTNPERRFLKDIAGNVAAELQDAFDYIDLGPGTEHKEQFLFDALQKMQKQFRYVPVDVSNHYLAVADAHAKGQGIETVPIRAPFEDLAKKLSEPTRPRFVSLGLTFSNYEPQQAIAMLCRIAGKGGKIFIDVHLRERTNIDEVQSIYENDLHGVVNSKLELLGLNSETDVHHIEVDDSIRFWCAVNTPTEAMKKKGFKSGDRMLVFQSLRYTRDQFEYEMQASRVGYTIIDKDGPFIGALISTEY